MVIHGPPAASGLTLSESSTHAIDTWLETLNAPARRARAPIGTRIARDTLYQLYYPRLRRAARSAPRRSATLGPAARRALLALDPAYITLEPEYYADVDAAKLARVKPLLWLWRGFDSLA